MRPAGFADGMVVEPAIEEETLDAITLATLVATVVVNAVPTVCATA